MFAAVQRSAISFSHRALSLHRSAVHCRFFSARHSRSTPPSNVIPLAVPEVRGTLTAKELDAHIRSGAITQVILAFPDMYGRLLGKRFDGEFFKSDGALSGTHACNYLLANDMEMAVVKGYEYANWERGFGDFHLVCDQTSIRAITWQPQTAMVMCNLEDDATHSPIRVAPRSILNAQLEAAKELGDYTVNAASELEYYTFEQSYRQAHAVNYAQKRMAPVGDYFADYHLLQTVREERYSAAFRHHLKHSGIPIENSKGECGIGQHELNIRFSDCLTMSDRHSVYKQCLKEVSDQLGVSVTFMAKPFTDSTGSGCHIHLSMSKNNRNAFLGEETIGPNNQIKCSKLFKHFLAGWLKYTPDCMVFYAPTINSYKRFVSESWAPTRLSWSYDNRTAGFRVVGAGGEGLRIECRIPGADTNIYLAFAASLASGLRGIRDKLEPPPMFDGNIYEAQSLPSVPKTLTDSIEIFKSSEFAAAAFGEDVVKHYTNFYTNEQAAFNKHVTDWERVRYFERI